MSCEYVRSVEDAVKMIKSEFSNPIVQKIGNKQYVAWTVSYTIFAHFMDEVIRDKKKLIRLKTISEDEGPLCYSCPIELLNNKNVDEKLVNHEWREEVIKYWKDEG